MEEIIREAQRRAGKKESLTLKLRDLGGLVRAAGDIAKGEHKDEVALEHVISAKSWQEPWNNRSPTVTFSRKTLSGFQV